MIKMKRLDYLIDYLMNENPRLVLNEKLETFEDKFRIYRSLVNIRKPMDIDREFINVEDEFLQDLLKNKDLTSSEDINPLAIDFPNSKLSHKDKIALWQGDITTLEVDAIVNAANSQGTGCYIPCHNCIDNQIHTYAGVDLRLECEEKMKKLDYALPSGNAFITNAYNLPSKHVIHTVGPIIVGHVTETKEKSLAQCYHTCLNLAIENNIKSIAFPCISTGEFRFPKELACQIAINTVEEFLDTKEDYFDKIIFNVYSDEDYKIYENFITK